jgi:malonyl-CoA decarboxylase
VSRSGGRDVGDGPRTRRRRLPSLSRFGLRRGAPTLGATLGDVRTLVAQLLAGSESSSQRAAASQLVDRYSSLPDDRRRAVLRLVATEFGTDREQVDRAVAALAKTAEPGAAATRADAERALRLALTPAYTRLGPLISALPRGVKLLVDLRADLLVLGRREPELVALDRELQAHLRTLFDIGVLELTRVTWDSPAALLEKLIRYEAVNEIRSWDELHGRLVDDRRLYAFFHPAMPGEPLVFVEVALTRGIVAELPTLLADDREHTRPEQADTAIFYSITNPHSGLAGVQLGNELIKRVVDEVRRDHPQVRTFATLSPIPSFRRWYDDRPADADPDLPRSGGTGAGETVEHDDPRRDTLLRACARYLLEARTGGRAVDPVANFHLSNGASIARVNWHGDPSPTGLQRSYGITVNYLYDPKAIERNARAYLGDGTIAASDDVRGLLERS